ncbi:MAG: ribonuclease R [Malacoplasma sp.]
MENIRNKILEIIRDEKGRPILPGIVYKKIESFYNNKRQVYSTIDNLLLEGVLKSLPNNKLVLEYENGEIDNSTQFEGYIFLNAKFDGFVKRVNSENVEVYINKKNVNGALNGDKVICALMNKEDPFKKLKDGVIISVVERDKDFFTGTFLVEGDSYKIVVDDVKMNLPIILDDISGLVDGHKILIKLSRFDNKNAYGTVSKIIGHKNSVGVDIMSIVYDNGLEPEFSDEVINASKEFSLNINETEKSKRVDLTSLDIITIDPKESKDLDDAIYVKKVNDNYKLYVCIADVSHYVTPNSIVDQEAFKRGTSVYLVNQVIPMLPHNLSNDICSLNPHEDRLSMTCEMLINKDGEFLDIKVYDSIINSKRRFSYEEVNDFFANPNSLAKDPIEIKDMLSTSFELYKILKAVKNKKGYINFDIAEPKIILDENGKIIDIEKKETGDAQMMIENFMVAANEAVTINFNKYHKKFVYRVHNKPDDKKIASFKIEAKKLNFKIDDDIKNIKSNTISKWLENNKDNPNKDLINLILLRAMAKAQYSTQNIGHFGLASEQYTHFTSPIRRYPDLMVHRMYRMFLIDKDKFSNEDRSELMNSLKEVCEKSSKNEIIATDTERSVNSMKFAEFMEDKIGNEYDGFVIYVTNFGVFVQLENTIEGLVKLENIHNSYYEYDPNEQQYIEKNTKRILTLGTKVKVRVIGASKSARRINFEIINFI